ncbi:hypothetical protein H5410_040528 [Solanum commersonii]|uniref:DUF8040 domain-containing protein n=1 Tax=Solanum commersonii TaxID=4109 RepID=A0A9J5XSS4_SOLCO|nr:hypothetical protein H5410_040528 [Solanum commersonii]
MSARIPKILSHLYVLIHDNDIVCIDKLRMDRNVFHILASLAKNIEGLIDSKNMSSTEKLAMFLNILAHHEKNKSVKVNYIRLGWSGCLGALDGTYISIRVEAIYKPRYRIRKGDIATNVLEICDVNLNFIYVLPGWEGSVANGRVLRDAVVRKNGLKVPQGRWEILRSPSWYSVKIEMASSTAATSNTSRKRGRKSTPSSLRVWTPEEELTLVDGLKELCVNGFQYSDESILVDDPKAWDDLIKKEIFGKDRATGEFAEGPEDVVEEIERIEAQEINNGMSLGFPFVVIDVDDASGKSEDQATQEEPNVSTGATQSPFTAQDEPNELTGAVQSSFTTQKGETHQSHKQGKLDLSEIRGKIFSIIGSPAFEIYKSNE